MDWTFDEADRPQSRFYDQRRRIKDRLSALPLEVAIGFIGLAGSEWRYAYRLLGQHPTHMPLAA